MKLISASLIVALMMGSASALAATDSSQLDFELEATIPAARYYVNFQDPTFGTQPQTMDWNQPQDKLDNVSTNLLVKNTVGTVKAYLQSAAQLNHDNGTDTIPLAVTIKAQELPTTSAAAVEIQDAATTTEEVVAMVVSPKGTPAYISGDYAGDVTLMFDYDLP